MTTLLKEIKQKVPTWQLVLGIAILGCVGLIWGAASRNSDSNMNGTITRSDIIQKVTVSGTVVPNRKMVISAPYSGYVRKIFVKIGDQVKPGDPIISVAQSLRENSSEIFPLRAPFSGTVVQVLRTEGEYVEGSAQNTNALVRIDDLTQLYIDSNAPESDIEKIQLGQIANIQAAAINATTYRGSIEHISLAAKDQKDWEKSRVEFPLQIKVLNADSQLKPGMSVIADIIIKKLQQVLTLRHEYIQKSKGEYFVITEKGEKKPIQVGTQNEDVFEIVSGLKEGDRVRMNDFAALLEE